MVRYSIASFFLLAIQATFASGDQFTPLSCNSNLTDLNLNECPLLSSIDSVDSHGMRHIPCGTCASLDIVNGETLDIPTGLSIEGKLHVPSTAHGILNTTAVVVQGELQIDPPSQKFVINLFGTQDVMFTPSSTTNAAACESTIDSNGTACNLGKKPIAVLGGTLQVSGLVDAGCPSWVKLQGTDETEPAAADDYIGEYEGPQLRGGDGDAESGGEGFNGILSGNARYPGGVEVTTAWEDEGAAVNTFYKIGANDSTKNSGLRVRLKQGDLKSAALGKTLTVSWRYRVNILTAADQPNQEWKGRALVRWGRYSRPKGTLWLPVCSEASNNNWVTCSSTFVVSGGMITNGWWWDINFVWSGINRMAGNELHFDDLQVTAQGETIYRPNIIKVTKDAANCWNVGDDILITSSSTRQDGLVVRTATAIDIVEGTITLDERIDPLENVLLSSEDGPDGHDFGVEVASLSRKLVFQGQDDDDILNPDHGGHLIVVRTPNVDQLLVGVEIRNFGQQGIQGRYPIHMHVSENVEGTLLAKNVIRESNQRCVVIHGTHNVTIFDNVAYDHIGHCYMLEDGGEWDNTFERNLGAKNARQKVEEKWTRTDVAEPATFSISNPGNHFIGNVAAGSVAHGFFIETLKRVIGPSAALAINEGHNPREQRIYTFRDNIAHSNFLFGVTTFGNQYQFRNGWSAGGGEPNLILNTKAYKNRKEGLRFAASKNVHIKGGILADNKRCIAIGLGSSNIVIEDLRCVAVSDHLRALGGPTFCGNDKSGIAVTIGEKGKEAIVRNVNFTGWHWDDLEHCSDGKGTAFQITDDGRISAHWSAVPQLNGGFSTDGPAFDIKCGFLNWAARKYPPGYKNVFVNDLDGSMGGTGNPGAFFATRERDPDASTFVNHTLCSNLSHFDSCAMYCDGPCMRKIIVQADPNFKSHVMVVTDVATGKKHQYTRDANSGGYPRHLPDFEAALPQGQYEVSFEDGNGNPGWPGYAKMRLDRSPSCSNYITESDVTLIMPNTIEQGLCNSMTLNGDLQSGTRTGWSTSWFGFQVKQEGNTTNYYGQTTNRKLTRSNLYKWVDMSCVRPGETYRFTGKFKLKTQEGVDIGCTLGAGNCASLSLRLTSGDDQNSPILSWGIGTIEVVGDGTWATFDWLYTLPDDAFPEEAYQALVMFRGAKKRNYAVDDFQVSVVS